MPPEQTAPQCPDEVRPADGPDPDLIITREIRPPRRSRLLRIARAVSGPWPRWVLIGAWVLLLLVPDLVIRHAGLGWPYPLTAAASLLGWWLTAAVVGGACRLARPLGAFAALLAGVCLTVFLLGTLGYHRFYRRDPLSLEWEFILENPAWALALVRDAATAFERTSFVLVPVLVALLLYQVGRGKGMRRPGWGPALLALGATAGAIYFGRSLSADLAGLRAVSYGSYGHFFKGGEPRTLPPPARLVVPSRVPRTQPNVLLVIHESLGAAAVFGPRGNAPALQAFVNRQPRALSFPRASAIATATCASR